MTTTKAGQTRRGLLRGMVVGLGSAAVVPGMLAAAPASRADSSPTPVQAADYFARVMADRGLHTPEAGEQWAWVVNYHVHGFTLGYETYGDTAWLDHAVRFYDFALSRAQRAPDGYLGWIGPYIFDGTVWCDVHVGDALVVNPMLRFAQIVLADRALRRVYGHHAWRYVRFAERHLLRKWDDRGTFHEDGPYGFYDYWDHFVAPGDLSRFVVRDDVEFANSTQQFNKQLDMGVTALRLHQLTGKEKYLDRAVRIFATHKSRLQYFDGHYVWNFRDPLAPYDVLDVATGELVSWTAVHPTNAGYQDREMHAVVEAYNAGVVYTRQDIERFLTTNLDVMWNGDLADPAFVGSNAAIHPEGVAPAAGTLWTALVQFDPTVRAIRERLLAAGSASDLRHRLEHHYYDTVVTRRPPSFDRANPVDEPRIFSFPFAEVRSLHMAAVLPSVIRRNDVAIVAVKSLVPGVVRTSLHAADGRELMVLDERHVDGGPDGRQGVLTFTWDGTHPSGARLPRGTYRVRWSLTGDGYREFPISLV